MHKSDQNKVVGSPGSQGKVSAPVQILTTDLMGPYTRTTSGFE